MASNERLIQGQPEAVPKFTSFRPKPIKAVNRNSNDSGDQLRSLSNDKVLSRDHGSKDYRHKRDRSSDHYHRTRPHRHRTTSPVKPPEVSIARQNHDYATDIRGDEDNLRYGSLHKYSVPAYHRIGFGRVLGLSLKQKIDRNASTDKRVVIHDSRQIYDTRRDKSIFARIQAQKETRIKSSLKRPPQETEADFLAFTENDTSLKTSDNRTGYDSDNSANSEDAHYRSIQGKAKASDRPNDLDLEYNDLSTSTVLEGVEENAEAVRKQKIGLELLTKTEKDPENGHAWLDLVEFQETRYDEFRMSNAETLSLADIKISLIEKALKQVKADNFREALLSELMKQGSKLWETSNISSKWIAILNKEPGYLSLWIQYIDFVQTTFSKFQYDELITVFANALKALRKYTGSNSSEIQCYIVLRATLCMKQAGFTEQAIGIWQAVLEFNLFRPENKSAQGTSDLQPFWDSEIPRIGEAGAQGWEQFCEGNVDPSEPQVDAEKPSSQSISSSVWSKLEGAVSERYAMPARTLDDVAEDDPYRVILFSDIEPFLAVIDASQIDMLLSALLAFCGLPPIAFRSANASSWWRDSFVRNDDSPSVDGTACEQSPSDETQKGLNFVYPNGYFVPSDGELFVKPEFWFPAFPARLKDHSTILWIRNTLLALVEKDVAGDHLSEYFIAFENTYYPSSVRKTAKTLLRKHSSNLHLYNAFALIEYRNDKRSSAESVLATTINMASGNPDAIFLWKTWVWELLSSDGLAAALARLLTITDSEVNPQISPSTLPSLISNRSATLRTYRHLTDSIHHLASTHAYSHTIQHIVLLTLLSYFTSSDPLSAALSTFTTHASLIPFSSPALELLYQFVGQLIYYHTTTHKLFSPSLIRPHLIKSLTLFPQNSILLLLFAHYEARFRIDDRVRLTINEILHHHPKTSVSVPGMTSQQDQQTILTHLFAIHTEQQRANSGLFSNANSIRAAFERAATSHVGKHSIVLWKKYFLWEHEQGEKGRAKKVFYRAMMGCPWAKEIYMLAFEFLGEDGVMGQEELKGLWEIMVDKELRIRVDLEEMLETMRERES